jgi:hypothetical protein
MDLPKRLQIGSYIRINIGGRDVPTYSVSRSKSGNWGFVMESCWGVWASFELPPQKTSLPRSCKHLGKPNSKQCRNAESSSIDNELKGETRIDRTEMFNNGDGNVTNESNLQDENLLLTNEVQWREAFLYNVGAHILPDGDEATTVFDGVWGGMYQ